MNGLLLHKSNLMQNVPLLCCEEPPSGRDGEQKIHLKITENERRKYLQENKEKLEDYFLPPSTSSFQNFEKILIATYPGRQSHLSLGVETYRKHRRELIIVLLVLCYSFGLSRE